MVPTNNLKADFISFFKKAVVRTMMVLVTANAAGPALAAGDTHDSTPDGPQTSAPPHASHSGHAHDWNHVHQNEWGKLSETCNSGQFQSPINLVAEGEPVDLPPWQANYASGGVALNVENNGHTIQVNYPEGHTVTVDGKEWELKQFHFHAPSEYTLDGERFPMEVHFVHKDDAGNLLVIGMMMKAGAENATLAKIWDRMPAESGISQTHADVKINAADFYPQEHGTGNAPYFQLTGSLTTPPCSEGVTWIVLKDPIQVSTDQIKKFENLFPAGNSRELQTARPATLGF